MIGMGRVIAQGANLGADGHQRAVDARFPGAAENDVPQGARRLVADEEHGGIAANEIVAQVVLDAPGIGHARRTDNNCATADGIDGLGFLHALDDAEAGIVEQFFGAQFDIVEHFRIFAIDAGDLAGEGRVEEDQARIDLA
ncbi:hypothetical protein D3C72_1958980 [compost metagenome]